MQAFFIWRVSRLIMDQMMKTLNRGLAIMAGCFFVMNSAGAFADECDLLNEDATWNDSMIKLIGYMTAQDYDKAEELSHQMSLRCSRSPMLNYIQGKIQEEKSDVDAAKLFYQKASEYTYDFAVAPDTSKKIWYARYEAENPERTQAGILKLQMKKQMTDEALEKSEAAYHRIELMDAARVESDYNTLLWTGAGIGIGGLVTLLAGGIIAGSLDNDEKYELNRSDRAGIKEYRVTDKFMASLVLMGMGATATVAGAVLSGIYGYKISHLGEHNYTVHIDPSRFAFSMTF